MLRGTQRDVAGWTYQFLGLQKSFIWQEADYIKHPQWGVPEFHSGKGALRTHSDGNGHTMIAQDVDVAPKTTCAASVWVRAVDLPGKGLDQDLKDSVSLLVLELDSTGKIVHRHAKVEVKKAGPYQQLTRCFTTGPSTAQIRFILDTVIHCPYQEGHVTYYDCSLMIDRP